jgi:Uma2 family endonuclease
MSTETLTIPPLAAGQRLTRSEFERRWDALPDLRRAELIDGVVYMAAAVRYEPHGFPHLAISNWISNYLVSTPGVGGALDTSVRLEGDNVPQPDIQLFIRPDCGGQVELSADGYIVGGPDLVVEIAASSEVMDLGPKMRVYFAAGVREYIVWRTAAESIEWYVRASDRFELLPVDVAGWLHSIAFPGLILDPAALLRSDLVRVNSILQQGLSGSEHDLFVRHLAAVRAARSGS